MSVWLTPDLEPFYGGTYFPPEARQGLPGFSELLNALGEAWVTKRKEIDEQGKAFAEFLRTSLRPSLPSGKLSADFLGTAANQSAGRYDAEFGGFASAPRYAPKFPHATELSALLLHHSRHGEDQSLKIATRSLTAMHRGGIFDQLAGGFHRYTVDREWLVPHFEKMLYDNALLAQTYVEAFQYTGEERFRQVAVETLDYLMREMQDDAGGFYSATDADSEGVEGKFFVWTEAEIDAALGEASPLFKSAYGVTASGNWHEMPGVTILSQVLTTTELAEKHELAEPEVVDRLAASRQILLELRRGRVPPLLDDKVITAWNGMAIAALARAYTALGEEKYLRAAQKAAGFVLDEMRREDGRLLRTWRLDEAKLDAYLVDYGFLTDGLLHLFEADFDPRWLGATKELLTVVENHFRDPEDGSLFFTADDHETLIARTKDITDGAIPSGAALVIGSFVRGGLLMVDE